MLYKTCFVCYAPTLDQTENTETTSWLKVLLELVGISFETFTGDLLHSQSYETVSRECTFCQQCSTLVDDGDQLRNRLRAIQQKLTDAAATGYRNRKRIKIKQEVRDSEAAQIASQLAYRLGECFTRPAVVIRLEDVIPVEKLSPQVKKPILIIKHEPEADVYVDNDFGNFSDGMKPEQALRLVEFDHPEEETAPPPLKRKRGRPRKVVVEVSESKQQDQKQLSGTASNSTKVPEPKILEFKTEKKQKQGSKNQICDRKLNKGENSDMPEVYVQHPIPNSNEVDINQDNCMENRRSTRKSIKKPIVELESSAESDTGEFSENGFSPPEDNTSSSEESAHSNSAESGDEFTETKKFKTTTRKKYSDRADSALKRLRQRNRRVPNLKFRCGKCSLTGIGFKRLDAHVKDEHQTLNLADRPYGCSFCPVLYHTSEDLKKHIGHHNILKGQKVDCLLCEASDDLPNMVGHYFEEHGLEFLKCTFFGCSRCLQAFKPAEGNLRSGSVGPDDVQAFRAFAEEHRNCTAPEQRNVPQQCRSCPETRLTAAELVLHEVTHFPGIYCKFCDVEFETESARRIHDSDFHRKYLTSQKYRMFQFRCHICGRRCRFEKTLATHMENHHANDSAKTFTARIERRCPLCEFVASDSVLRNHVRRVHALRLFLGIDSNSYFLACHFCLTPFKPSDSSKPPGRFRPEDAEKLKEFSAEHALCHEAPISQFSCPKCEDQFNTPTSLFRHCFKCFGRVEVRKKPVTSAPAYSCEPCSSEFDRNQSQDSENVQSVLDCSNYQCRPCLSGFDTNIEYLHHLRLQHSNENKIKCQCHRCGKHFQDVQSLRNHVTENSKLLRCSTCHQNFHSSESYQNHKCETDKLPEPEEVAIEVPSHCIQLTGGFRCMSCSYLSKTLRVFETNALLSLHFQEYHDKVEDPSFTCRICSQVLTSSVHFKNDADESFYLTSEALNKQKRKHPNFTSLCTHHWKNCLSKSRSTPCHELAEPSLECYICHQNQDTPQTLAVHLNEHRGTFEVHRCKICTMFNKHTITLGKHYRRRHNLRHVGNDQFYCKSCNEPYRSTNREVKVGSFAEEDVLHFHAFVDQHFQCKAEKVIPTCGFCGMFFSEVRTLFLHEVRVHLTKSRNHTISHYCDQCGKGFTELNYLKSHMKKHGQRETYKCHLCDKSFIKKDYLAQHLTSHNKEPAMVCQYCGKGFSIRCSLIRHEQNHFVVAPTEPTVPCTICGKLFTTVKYMKYHITYNHQKHPRKARPSSSTQNQPDHSEDNVN